jgi:hypothetical protein
MNIRAFSLMAMAFTILCLVADLVCYLQYVRLSGNPFIRASSARNPLVAAIEFIVKNVLLRLTPYVVVWYLLSFGYLLGLYRFHSGTLPPAFHQFYASVVAPPNPAAAPATLRVPVSRSAVRRTRMTPEGKCKGGPQWTEFLQ